MDTVSASLVIQSGAPVSKMGEKLDLGDFLCGNDSTIAVIKRRGYWRIGEVLVAGLVGGAATWIFWGIPVATFVFLFVGVVPHFTPWGAVGIFFDASRAIEEKMAEICKHSTDTNNCDLFVSPSFPTAIIPSVVPNTDVTNALTKITILHDAWLPECRAETDPNLKMNILALYKSILDIFKTEKDGKNVLVQAIQAIDSANLSSERKVLFIRAVKDCVGNETAPGAILNDGIDEPGIFARAYRWCSSFMCG
jgi:hypothetical protein